METFMLEVDGLPVVKMYSSSSGAPSLGQPLNIAPWKALLANWLAFTNLLGSITMYSVLRMSGYFGWIVRTSPLATTEAWSPTLKDWHMNGTGTPSSGLASSLPAVLRLPM